MPRRSHLRQRLQACGRRSSWQEVILHAEHVVVVPAEAVRFGMQVETLHDRQAPARRIAKRAHGGDVVSLPHLSHVGAAVNTTVSLTVPGVAGFATSL